MAYKNKTNRISRQLAVILALTAFFIYAPTAWANPKVSELQRKIADLNLLQQQLIDRANQAESARGVLLTQQQELVAEITVLTRSDGIHTYRQAQNNLRIHYNLMLLGTLEVYIQSLESKLRLYQTGNDKLRYLSQLADDDIKMITTLNDLQIDALTTQISLVINRYLPEAHVIQIDPVRIEPLPPKQVWENMFKSD